MLAQVRVETVRLWMHLVRITYKQRVIAKSLWDDEPAAATDGLIAGNSAGAKLIEAENSSGYKPVSLPLLKLEQPLS